MRTEHGELMDQWERLPLPLAQLGLHLGVRDGNRWQRALAFVEALVGLSYAYGLAAYRRDQRRLPPWEELDSGLSRSSLGHRVDLLQSVVSGWALDAEAEGCSELVRRALGEAQMPKRRAPSVGQALQALVAARNQLAHPNLPSDLKDDLLDAFVKGAAHLAKSNTLFIRRLLRCDGFSATARGTPGVVASSMTGLGPVPYRQGRAIEAPGVEFVGQLFLLGTAGGEPGVHLEPFVYADGDDVFFLADVARGQPRYWSPASNRHQVRSVEDLYGAPATPSPGWTPQGAQHAGGAAAPDAAPETPLRGVPRRARGLPWSTLGWAIVAAVSLALGGLAFLLWSEKVTDVPPDIGRVAPQPTSAATAPVTTPPHAPREPEKPREADELLSALLGLDVSFGAPLEQVEPHGYDLRPARCRGARDEILPGQPWASVDLRTPEIPGQRRTFAMVDKELGLFEANVYTQTEPMTLARWVESRLQRPPTASADDGSWFRWRTGERQVNVARNRHGNTMLIVFHDPRKISFTARRSARCGGQP